VPINALFTFFCKIGSEDLGLAISMKSEPEDSGRSGEAGLIESVTQRIRSLESSLSTTLFTRSRKGMMLTHEGQALLRYCQASKELEGEALAQITGAGSQATVRICVTGPSSIMRSRML
jgi:bifunctional ADP-heptose synthase (sugar kinase/adenylyltransferase)